MAGYFSDDSMLRRIHRERALALSGPRALLMQAAHPLAVSGLLAHSTAIDEPYDRLARTAEVMSTIARPSCSAVAASRLDRIVRGSASRALLRRSTSRRRRLAGEEIASAMNGAPRVVLPISR